MKRRRLTKKGLLFVVSAPSGCGKTTICKKLTSTFPRLSNSVSVTTRPPRDNEVDGKDYYFVSKDEFLEMRRRDELLEWAPNFGHLYGTPAKGVKEMLGKNKDILLAIDVKGARKVKKKIPKSIHIFLMPPSISDLQKRLKKRGTDSRRAIRKRLKIAKSEIAQAEQYDYIVVNNSINNAVRQLKAIVASERERLKN